MPTSLGKLDWSAWFYGMFYAFIGGGSGALGTGIALPAIDSEHFNSSHPRLILEAMVVTFIVSGLPSFFGFLHQNPLPAAITVTSTETTTLQTNPPAIVVQTVQTTKAEEPTK